jgi:S1-C subfamily serine protease
MASITNNSFPAGAIRARRCSKICFLFLLLAAGAAPAAEPAGVAMAPQTRAIELARPKGIADLKALESRVRQVVAKVTPCVVAVAGGSGVVVSRDGYVLCVAHVGERAGRTVDVTFADGRRAKAVTLGNDRGVDAGMLKLVDSGPWPSAEMGTSANLQVGQWCVTLGYPVSFEHGKPPAVRLGRVLVNRTTEIITDCTIMGGDSGAPLVDLDGKVIGIGTKCDNSSLVYNISVPIDRYRDQWQALAQGKDFDSLGRPAMLGIFAAVGAADARIGDVVPGGGAQRAGLKAGDVIVKFAGQEIHRYEDIPPLVQARRPGDRVEVEFRRGERVFQAAVILGEDDSRKEED